MDMKVSDKAIDTIPLILDDQDQRLITRMQLGLPMVAQPYAQLGRELGMSEEDVIQRLQYLLDEGVIKRMGVVVRHHELGYRANAMTVWDMPDDRVTELGRCIGQFEFVTLCYRRPRRLPEWPYNLFTMIHGQDRDEVMANIDMIHRRCGLESVKYEVLFSTRRFKQRGAIYRANSKS